MFHKGIELAEIDEHYQAISIFDELLSTYKNNVNVMYAKARSKAALNENTEAIELLKKSISKEKAIRDWAREEKVFEKFYKNDEFKKLVKI